MSVRQVPVPVPVPVPMEECKRRALAYLQGLGDGEYAKASRVALEIWPGVEWRTSQGGGGAASRVLRALEKDGVARWGVLPGRGAGGRGVGGREDWGWQASKGTDKGVVKREGR